MPSASSASEVTHAKCVLVGDPAVGKTAITQMFLSEGSKFPKSYNLTFAVELSTKFLQLEESDKKVELLLYDSSGHDIYADILVKCWHGCSLMMAVYDVTNIQSLASIVSWVQQVRHVSPVTMPAVLFGNKCDLDKRRVVSRETADEVAHSLGMVAHLEGSAKDYMGVREAFMALVQQLENNH